MSEEERARLEHELRLEMLRQDWSAVEAEIEDRINARALAQAELLRGNAFTNVLAAVHRPLWSLVTLGLFVANVIGPVLGWPEFRLGEIERDIMRTVIIFYFGGRTVEKSVQLIRGAGAVPSAGPPQVPPPPLPPRPTPSRPAVPTSAPSVREPERW
jgi:hypothetical protein